MAGASVAQAGEVLDRVRARGAVQVCIWPDYLGVSYRNPKTEQLVGVDIDLSIELARDLSVALRHVNSSFRTLVDDLQADRCDVAMFAIGMSPARLEALRFSKPYLRSDVYAVTTRSSRVVKSWQDIDRAGVRVAVQADTFMHSVMAQSLKHARLVVIEPPDTREQELEAGRVDVFMTDYPYSKRLASQDWVRLIAPPQPFHVLPYGYAVKPGDEAWLARINEFVALIKRDGRLESAARRHGLSEILVRE
ncbi:MAG: ABC transporter substrate-binding protein [Leptothrix sp. (in: b-proteobacteria)]